MMVTKIVIKCHVVGEKIQRGNIFTDPSSDIIRDSLAPISPHRGNGGGIGGGGGGSGKGGAEGGGGGDGREK